MNKEVYRRSYEKKFVVDMSNGQHTKIKQLAHDCGMSMNELLLVAVAEFASKISKQKKKGWQDET